MKNRDRFLAGDIFKYCYSYYQFAETTTGKLFIRKGDSRTSDFKYYANIESLGDEGFTAYVSFFCNCLQATIEFRHLEFADHEGVVQQ
jgi:glutamate/tyrosine decarboxylase-like PLP-dependent enzyme